jgi:nucleoside-diphosphate-sugar epimerase
MQGKTITVFGDGQQLRDALYVDDAVNAFLSAGIDNTPGVRIYNVGSSLPCSIGEIARTIQNACGRVEPDDGIEFLDFPADRRLIDIGSYISDISKIGRELGWRPRIDLRAGVKKTLAFYNRFVEHYLNGPLHSCCKFEGDDRQLPGRVAAKTPRSH